MRRLLILCFAVAAAVAAPEPKARSLGPASAPGAKQWPFTLVGLDGTRLDLTGYSVGRGGYSIRTLANNPFAARINVVTPTRSRHGEFLGFEYIPAGTKVWRVGLAERRGAAFHTVAVSDHEGSWADWAVASPDGKRVAAWVAQGEHVLHVMKRDGAKLVVTQRLHAEAHKAFPKFAANGRLAARLPLKGEPLQFANSIDGKLGERLRACREVEFDATGERWAYAGLAQGRVVRLRRGRGRRSLRAHRGATARRAGARAGACSGSRRVALDRRRLGL